MAALWRAWGHAGWIRPASRMNSSLFLFLPLLTLLSGPVSDVRTAPPAVDALEQGHEGGAARQVRIERRVIIRIAPSPAETSSRMLSLLPRRQVRQSFVEEPLEDGCVATAAIGGVEPTTGNRLLLFMRDRRVLAARLAPGCNAADFYSGFYLERSDDGRLCRGRDRLQSRAGSSCQVAGLSRLVAIGN